MEVLFQPLPSVALKEDGWGRRRQAEVKFSVPGSCYHPVYVEGQGQLQWPWLPGLWLSWCMLESDPCRGGFSISPPFWGLQRQKLPCSHVLGGIPGGHAGACPSRPPSSFVHSIPQLHFLQLNIARRVWVFCNWLRYSKYYSDHLFVLNSSHLPKPRGILIFAHLDRILPFFLNFFCCFSMACDKLSVYFSILGVTSSFCLRKRKEKRKKPT